MRSSLYNSFVLVLCAALVNGGCSAAVTSSDVSASTALTTVYTLAGVQMSQGSIDGKGTQAKFNGPSGAAVVSNSAYIADALSNTIRKVSLSTGVVTTFVGTPGITGDNDGTGAAAEFSYPEAIATDGTNLYVTDSSNSTIRKIVIATKVVTTLAGTAGVTGDADGTGAAAEFNGPTGITTDGTNLFVSDTGNHTIRKIVIATGVVTTLAGDSGTSGDADGTGVAAEFSAPTHLVYSSSHLYVADKDNEAIRKIVVSTGVVTTFAGTAGSAGDTDDDGADARFTSPYSIAVDDDDDYLYVTDSSRSTIRKIEISTAEVETLAGDAGTNGYLDDTGDDAFFFRPRGVIVKAGNVFVIDTENNAIRKIVVSTGVVTTLAGVGPSTGTANGTGDDARFDEVTGLAATSSYVYAVDTDNSTIRRISTSLGAVTTFAGAAGVTGTTDATTTAARFNLPRGIATDGTYLFVADTANHTVRQIVISSGVVTTLAGDAGTSGDTNATGVAAEFSSPGGIATDGTNVYVSDTGNHLIRKIVIATGVVTTLAGNSGNAGDTDATGVAAEFNGPTGITTDGTNVYVSDTGNHLIRKIVIATGVVTTLAGDTGTAGDDDGTGTAAEFRSPRGIATDETYLYVADTGNAAIRQIEIATGIVTTLTGSYNADSIEGDHDGALAAATFNDPVGIAYGSKGLYIGNDSCVRWIY